MRKIVRVLTGFFLLLVFFTSIAFSYFNTTPVSIAFGFWEAPVQPISVWLILAFTLGGLIGLVLGLKIIRNLKSKSEIRRLKKQLADAQHEVQELRSISLQDLK
jgi:putative membrane protein